MSRRLILTDPNPQLRKRSEEILPKEFGTPELDQLLTDLFDTMQQADGIGIAAPQIGVHKRLIIGLLENTPTAFMNPVITRGSWRKTNSEEGCLSVPETWGMVRRHRTVTLTWQDKTGATHKKRLKGMDAVVAQHEIDHLDGVLFIDKVYKYTTKPNTL